MQFAFKPFPVKFRRRFSSFEQFSIPLLIVDIPEFVILHIPKSSFKSTSPSAFLFVLPFLVSPVEVKLPLSYSTLKWVMAGFIRNCSIIHMNTGPSEAPILVIMSYYWSFFKFRRASPNYADCILSNDLIFKFSFNLLMPVQLSKHLWICAMMSMSLLPDWHARPKSSSFFINVIWSHRYRKLC